jgi:hypothetical protein
MRVSLTCHHMMVSRPAYFYLLAKVPHKKTCFPNPRHALHGQLRMKELRTVGGIFGTLLGTSSHFSD